jgi:hypothetical protein
MIGRAETPVNSNAGQNGWKASQLGNRRLSDTGPGNRFRKNWILPCRPAFTNAFFSSVRITLGPYRKCPGVKGPRERRRVVCRGAFDKGVRRKPLAPRGVGLLWVLNVGEGVAGGVAGLVGSGESGRADWQQRGDGLLSRFRDGWNDSFRLRGTRRVRTSKRTWFSSNGLSG